MEKKNKIILSILTIIALISGSFGTFFLMGALIPPGYGPTSAIYHSTPEGGDWHDHTTWVEDYVPTKIDIAIISDNSQVNITEDADIKQIELHSNSKLSITNSNLTFFNGDNRGFLIKKYSGDLDATLLCSFGNISSGYSSYWNLYEPLDTPPQPLNIIADNSTFWNYHWGQMHNSPEIKFDNCTLKCGYSGNGCIRITGDDYTQDTIPFFKNCNIVAPFRIYASGLFENCVIDIGEVSIIAENADEIMIFYKCLFPGSPTIPQIYKNYYPFDMVGGDGIVVFDYRNNEMNPIGEYVMVGGKHDWVVEHSNPLYLSNIPEKYRPRFTDNILISGGANPYYFETHFDMDYIFNNISIISRGNDPVHVVFENATFYFSEWVHIIRESYIKIINATFCRVGD